MASLLGLAATVYGQADADVTQAMDVIALRAGLPEKKGGSPTPPVTIVRNDARVSASGFPRRIA